MNTEDQLPGVPQALQIFGVIAVLLVVLVALAIV